MAIDGNIEDISGTIYDEQKVFVLKEPNQLSWKRVVLREMENKRTLIV